MVRDEKIKQWGASLDDRIGFILVGLACIYGMKFALGSVGYLLGFNATTLWLASISFSVLGLGYLLYPQKHTTEEQLAYVPLALIPIALRSLIQGGIFSYFHATMDAANVSGFTQIRYLFEVLGIWIMVAVSEEGMRAATMMLTSIALPDSWEWENLIPAKLLKGLVSNLAWIVFHFFQRDFYLQVQLPYVIWLFIAGAVFTYIMKEASFGAAVLAHIIVNLTA